MQCCGLADAQQRESACRDRPLQHTRRALVQGRPRVTQGTYGTRAAAATEGATLPAAPDPPTAAALVAYLAAVLPRLPMLLHRTVGETAAGVVAQARALAEEAGAADGAVPAALAEAAAVHISFAALRFSSACFHQARRTSAAPGRLTVQLLCACALELHKQMSNQNTLRNTRSAARQRAGGGGGGEAAAREGGCREAQGGGGRDRPLPR
jgi:hypothetical protein